MSTFSDDDVSLLNVRAWLVRLAWPLLAVAAALLRPTLVSSMYLAGFLVLVTLPNAWLSEQSARQHTLLCKALLGLSLLATLAQIVFQIVLAAYPPYGSLLEVDGDGAGGSGSHSGVGRLPATDAAEGLRQIGLYRLDIDWLDVLRLTAPDVGMAVWHYVTLRALLPGERMWRHLAEPLLMGVHRFSSLHQLWTLVSTPTACNAAATLALFQTACLLPSALSSVYMAAGLYMLVRWGLEASPTLPPITLFRFLPPLARQALGLFAGAHLLALHLFQISSIHMGNSAASTLGLPTFFRGWSLGWGERVGERGWCE